MTSGLCYGAPCMNWVLKRSCSVVWQDECPGMTPPDGHPPTITLGEACPQECSAQSAYLCGGAPCSEWVQRRACTVVWQDECPGAAAPSNFPPTVKLYEACPHECAQQSQGFQQAYSLPNAPDQQQVPPTPRFNWKAEYWGPSMQAGPPLSSLSSGSYVEQ